MINIKKNKSKFISKILLVLGLALILYPTLSNIYNDYKFKSQIEIYNSNLEEKNYDEKYILKKAKEYNKSLSRIEIYDPFSEEKTNENLSEYHNILNIEGLMGYIEIPKIKIKIPIRHGVSERVLNSGAGHLEGTSLPIGGKGNNSVITAHRGLPSSKLFTDIDKLEIGDSFILRIMSNSLFYKVIDIKIIEPNEIDAIETLDNKDLVTLLTCTPYGINSHRLLVIGERLENYIDFNSHTCIEIIELKNLINVLNIILIILLAIRMIKYE